MNFPRPLAVIALALIGAQTFSHTAEAKVDRPPQYVVMAFDGSKSLPMWQETREYAKTMTAQGKPLKFTYFINAAYYLSNPYKAEYDAPEKGYGKSAIGFGGTLNDVINRFEQTNLAKAEGNEIANHAAGHWDGTRWNAVDWEEELSQFDKIFFGLFDFNHMTKAIASALQSKWQFTQKDMIGFRAPQLGRNADMFAVLPKFGIQYDTSDTAPPSQWPRKKNQLLWSFPLAQIPIAGTGKKTLSMDYNFYYAQTGGQTGNPALFKAYEDQMFYSYVDYFFNNYNGNRAPVNIGHHFSKWNGGAYWNAMRRLADLVCGMPEVKCITYTELLDKMNELEKTPALLAAYQAGDFERTNAPRPMRGRALIMPRVKADIDESKLMQGDPAEAHEQ